MTNKKNKKSLKLNNKIIADFYFQQDDVKVQKYLKLYTSEYKRLVKFFKLRPPKLSIYFLYTREEMDQKFGGHSPDWLCGLVDKNNKHKIFTFSPQVFAKITSHKLKDLMPTIIHETAHTFVSQINSKCFNWVNEGICQFIEYKKPRQYRQFSKKGWQWFKKNNIISNTDIKWMEIAKHDGYAICHNLVKYLMKNYSQEVVFQLLKIKKQGNIINLNKKISKILGKDIKVIFTDFEKDVSLIDNPKK